MVLTIGSGQTDKLLMNPSNQGYQDLLRFFVASERPYWNSFSSPIDALRTGAILEFNYLNTLPFNYIFQKKVRSMEMDCFVASIDFAKIENNEVVDFDELKTINLTDFWNEISPYADEPESIYLDMIKKKFKKNYNQIQFQLFCTELESANLVFLAVKSYDDEENQIREIQQNEVVKFRIQRDESVISEIKEKGQFFQDIKDHFYEKLKPKKQKSKTKPKTEEKLISEPEPEEIEETPEIKEKPDSNPMIQNLLNTEIDI